MTRAQIKSNSLTTLTWQVGKKEIENEEKPKEEKQDMNLYKRILKRMRGTSFLEVFSVSPALYEQTISRKEGEPGENPS